MGNNQSSALANRAVGALDTYIAELGTDLILDQSLGTSRFLKTVRCRHKNGFVVTKIFLKPDSSPLDEKYIRRLKKEKKALQDIPNVYSYQIFLDTERAGYLVRQWAASNLYDRISTRPFLSDVEKKWIAFQILTGLRDASKKKVSHGDIKSENILVTSWTWVYITDFSSFKPTYLPLDNPSDFAYFYDTSGRRNCYIAPERFYTTDKSGDAVKRSQTVDLLGSGRNDGSRKEGKVTEAMDVFSAGCVLAELFLEGTPLFTLSQLFKYRVGEHDVDSHLTSLEPQVQGLIKSMIAIDSGSRPTFDQLLHTSRGSLFPESFYSLIHDFVSSVNDISSSSLFSNASNPFLPSLLTPPSIHSRSAADERTSVNDNPRAENTPLPDDSDRRMSRLWAEFEMVEPALQAANDAAGTSVQIDFAPQNSTFKPLQSVLPVVVSMSNQATRNLTASNPPAEDGPALIALSLICANLRNCSLASSKLRALDMLLVLSTYLTDEAKVDRLLPYVIELGHDESPMVRMSALTSALQVLSLVKAITPFNADIFPQFILPYLRYMTSDTETSVRSIASQSIVPFANLAVKFLEMGQALRAHGTFKMSGSQHYSESQMELSYDARIEELQNLVEDQMSLLLVDQNSAVKRAVLLDIAPLCIFFGRQKTNDVLLSHMITYLNDRDWLLRYAFFDSVVDVAACLGGRNLEEYIFPLMTQALSDVEETNVAKVLSALTTLSELGLFQKMRLWELMSSTLPLLYHPNAWIKQGAALFISSAAKSLPPTDVWCILYPSLRHFMRSDIRNVEAPNILKALKSPLPRHIYDFAMDWAMREGNSQFWRAQRKTASSKTESPKEAAISAARKGARGAIRITMKSEQDELQLNKLQQLGMNAPEKAKLVALRDYIAKSADAGNSLRSRSRLESDTNPLRTTGHVELQKLGVVPQTIFLGSRAAIPETIRKVSDTYNLNLARVNSIDQVTAGAGAPFEDLRRRLESINSSNASLASAAVTSDRTPMPPRLMTNVSDLPPALLMRPGSPTESVVSATNSVSVRPRFNVGTIEGAKAAPAVGQTRMNAVGLLEAPSRMSEAGDHSPTPFSVAHTARNLRSPSGATQESHDSTLNTYLDTIYTDLNNQVHNDFGPRTHDGPVRRRNAARQNFTVRDSKRRNVEATLIAHLSSHTAPVNGVAVSSDHLFFVTCSDDKTVKVWDSARLERNVTSKPRHTYTQHHSRVKCICMLERHHAFASAAEDGSLHIVRVHVNQSGSLPKYSKLQVVREHRLEKPGEYAKCMTHFTTDTSSNLIYATNFSAIVMFDLLTMRTILVMENPKEHGPMADFCLGRKKKWLITATNFGILSLWDLRFGLLLRTWNVGGPSGPGDDIGSSSGAGSARIRSCCLHPSKGRGRWVMVAIDCPDAYPEHNGTVLVEVWDVEKASLVEWYVRREAPLPSSATLKQPPFDLELPTPSSSSYSPSPSTSAETTNTAAAIAALVRSRQTHRPPSTESTTPSPFGDPSTLHPSPSAIFTSLVSGLDFGRDAHTARSFVDLALDTDRPSLGSGRAGFVLAAGEDCSVRLLDLEHFERSVVISEPSESDRDRPVFSTHALANTSAAEKEKDQREPTTPIVSISSSSTTKDPTPLIHIESPSPHASPHSGAGQRASVVNASQSGLLRAHQDCVRAVACLDAPFRGCVVSGDRAGVVKVWRVEGLGDGSGASGGVGF